MADTPSSQRDQRQAEVVFEHLPPGFTAGFYGSTDEDDVGNNRPSSLENGNAAPSVEGESSLRLQGGDIHRDLYKVGARARLQQRAATFAHPQPHRQRSSSIANSELSVSEQRQPGGFRRQYLLQRNRVGSFRNVATPVTRNFVEFLDLYGSFAGEDLADSEDEEAIVDDEDVEGYQEDQTTETRPLLGRRRSSRGPKKGDASTTKSFFTLLKAFVGTGIMFLPKAFNNGGILFSSMTLLTVSLVTLLAFHLLLECRSRYGGGGYGDLGEIILGPKMRTVILGSITISQIGFVCAGTVFVAENLRSFLNAVLNGPGPISTNALVALQLIVLIPLSFIRNISKLGPAALLADVFILIGLTYIYYFDIASISKSGISSTVVLFNPSQYTLTIGAAIFTFEGIGLILPIQSSMSHPHHFEPLLCLVMLLITIIFTSVGALCYATFGIDTQIEVIANYPQNDRLVNAVQFLYSLAVLVGTPVQLFPAIRILEGKLFGSRLSGKRNPYIKWKKNAFRTILVGTCAGISIAGSQDLDRFVALIGSFACVPLVYIYPPLLHYRGVASEKGGKWGLVAKAGDLVLIVAGVLAMAYTTIVTVINSFVGPE